MRRKNGILTAVLILVMSLMFTACEAPYVNWKAGQKIMFYAGGDVITDAEVRLIALQYKKQFDHYYSGLLTESFWEEEAADHMTFGEYVKDYYIYEECRALLILGRIAADNGIRLTGDEKKTLDAQAAETWGAYSESEKAYTNANEKQVRNVLCRYALAEKVIAYLTEGKNTEVNEEESRVAGIQVIRTEDEASAEEAWQRIEEGESFLAAAKQYTVDPVIEYTAEKGQLIDELNDTVFSMSEGDVSPVIEADGSWYIIRLSEHYDMLLSKNHKLNLLAERKFEAWQEVYEEYAGLVTLQRNSTCWNELSLQDQVDFSEADLFQGL